jgi:hypothetical protein
MAALWLFGLLYLGIATIVVKYRERKGRDSIATALHSWMVSCVYDCNFNKAFKIRSAMNRYDGTRVHYKDFLKSEVYPLLLGDFMKAQESFKMANTEYQLLCAVDQMALAEKRFDLGYAEFKKLF